MVSVLFYEPKFPKLPSTLTSTYSQPGFSALLRAEIPKIIQVYRDALEPVSFSALLRAEIPKIVSLSVVLER